MNRRTALTYGIGGLGAIIISAFSPSEAQGSDTMRLRTATLIDRGEPLIWQQPDRWERIARTDRVLESEGCAAFQREPGDPYVPSNQYHLRMGTIAEMHSYGSLAADLVQHACNFDSFSEWPVQKQWLPSAFRSFFTNRAVGLGWCSFATARKPAAFRNVENRNMTVSISQNADNRVLPLDSYEHIQLTNSGIPFSNRNVFATSLSSDRTDHRWAMVAIHRRIQVPELRMDHSYHEHWYCLANRDDYLRLQKGRLPAISDTKYGTEEKPVRVRDTILFNLMKLELGTQLRHRDWSVRQRSFEIDPMSGKLISIRTSSIPSFAAAILGWAKVEHLQINQLLSKAW